jgi:D-inositol-3-phosphate glycosyltransferase
MERGIDSRIITVGLGKKDGRQFFPDIPFHSVFSIRALESLDDTIIFISRPHAVKTKKKSYVMLHTQPPADPKARKAYSKAVGNKGIFTNSNYNRKLWSEYFDMPKKDIRVIYPFADPAFAKVKRLKWGVSVKGSKTRILYAGRLTGEKGIYTLLEALHHKIMKDNFRLHVTTAGNQTEDGRVIERFLRHHPLVRIVEATHTPAQTARLFAKYPIVVMPSNPTYWTEPFGYWRETFGMTSVEAQHAGCYVVASNDAGIPETDCGGLILFEPSNSYSLARALQKVRAASPLTITQRRQAIKHFTRAESVNALLSALKIDL